MSLRLYAPSVPEQAHRQEEPADRHHVETMLGLEVSAREVLGYSRIAEVREHQLSGQGSDTEAKE